MKAWFAIVVCIGIVVHCTSSAYAFHDARSFETPMVEGGGGGQYFSGSPRWKRYDCSVCHVGGQASLRIASLPAELIDDGVWLPNRSYQLVVELVGERQGLSSKTNHNGLIVEVVDGKNNPVSCLVASTPLVKLSPGGNILIGTNTPSVTRWVFEFDTPRASTGPLGIYIAVVDGNGANQADQEGVDMAGDDIATFARTLCLQGRTCDYDLTQATSSDTTSIVREGCSVASTNVGDGSWLLCLFFIGVAGRRRRGPRYDKQWFES
ncbi:MAG: hypothetical protein JKY56_06850 [Kofleriaceae bacterium]|nr:hypothetical protein [Kofleriaceae bacterium]